MDLQIKKTFGYKNRCEIKRKEFQRYLKTKVAKEIIYLDECGLRKNEICQYGWCLKGDRLHALKESSQHKTLNIIGGLKQGKMIAPFAFEGSCDALVFNTYVEKVLKQNLSKNTLIILDNASFHKASNIEEVAKSTGAEVLYLPPYSPDLNPIEHQWHSIKTKIRKLLRDGVESLSQAVTNAFQWVNNIN